VSTFKPPARQDDYAYCRQEVRRAVFKAARFIINMALDVVALSRPETLAGPRRISFDRGVTLTFKPIGTRKSDLRFDEEHVPFHLKIYHHGRLVLDAPMRTGCRAKELGAVFMTLGPWIGHLKKHRHSLLVEWRRRS